jgi:hypothetical protein
LIGRLETFVEQHNLPVSIEIIITSNWGRAAKLEDLKTHVFDRTGFGHRIVANIHDTNHGVSKVARHIMLANTIKAQPGETAGFIALDDNEFDTIPHYPDDMEEFVKVDGKTMLTAEDAERAYFKAEKQLRSKFIIQFAASSSTS